MTQNEANRLAIQAAQLLMSKDANIVVDGKWGSYTQSVYDKVSPNVRSAVDNMLSAGGTSASILRAARAEEKAAGIIAQANVTTVEDAIVAAAKEAGVDVATLRGFAKIESNLRANAVNGSSRGLMQMQPAAWADASKVVPNLPSYDKAVFDPLQNARAGAAYLKLNSRALLKNGFDGDISPAVLYLAHQQGAAGFMELWRASKGLPSKTNYVTAAAMRGNPPPDGKGVTVSKKEFYERWITAAAKKIALS